MTSSKAAFHVAEGDDETLHAAAYAGNKARVCMFFNSGGGTAASRDEDGRTPLHWACAGGHGKFPTTLELFSLSLLSPSPLSAHDHVPSVCLVK